MASRTKNCACGRPAVHHGNAGSACERCHRIEVQWAQEKRVPVRIDVGGMSEHRIVYATRGYAQRAWERWLGVGV